MKKITLLGMIALVLFLFCSENQAKEKAKPKPKSNVPVVLSVAKSELARTMNTLKSEQVPPYFLSYLIVESQKASIRASFGKIESSDRTESRSVDVDIRVGDYKFDNSHIIRGTSGFSFGSGSRISSELPIEDDEISMSNALWSLTDAQYKKAVETYKKAQTNDAVKVQQEDSSADFSKEEPYRFSEPDRPLKFQKGKWEERLRKITQLFASENWIYDGSASMNVEYQVRNFVSSEGSEIRQFQTVARISISAYTKADDGMKLPLYKTYFAFEDADLPDEATMLEDTKQLIANLKSLRTAPMMGTFTGPAILSGEAAGVFFHEIFGHRIEGHRLKDPNESQTFKSYLNKKILPPFLR